MATEVSGMLELAYRIVDIRVALARLHTALEVVHEVASADADPVIRALEAKVLELEHEEKVAAADLLWRG